jgi:hypothetical protein
MIMTSSIRNLSRSALGGLAVGIVLLSMLCSCAVVIRGENSGDRRSENQPPPKTYKALGIPPGHLPSPGYCRIWIPGRPPGHQPKPGNCAALERQVPKGAWLVYRDIDDPEHVEVYVYDKRRPSVVLVVRRFEVSTGRFLSEAQP